MHENRPIIIFDGVCNLCNAAVNYIIRHDPSGCFRFAPMQGGAAQRLIAAHIGSDFNFDTFLLIKDGRCYERGDAVVEIMKELKGGGLLFRIFIVLPKPVRDMLYRAAAKNRYRLFGRQEQCMVPSREVLDRFITS